MRVKQVFVNDTMIGEAQTWSDVDRLVLEKDLQFEGERRAIEGPTAFFLHGAAKVSGSPEGQEAARIATSPELSISERAAAIAKGLMLTERATKGVWFDQGMMRLECLNGGHYWISLDGSQVLRGASFSDAQELQAKFATSMAQACDHTETG